MRTSCVNNRPSKAADHQPPLVTTTNKASTHSKAVRCWLFLAASGLTIMKLTTYLPKLGSKRGPELPRSIAQLFARAGYQVTIVQQ